MRKKSKDPRLNKRYLKNVILSVFKESPFKKFNYKQLSKILKIKNIGEKILVHEALLGLEKEGSVKTPTKGSYVLAEQNKPVAGVVKNSNKGGVEIETGNGEGIFVDKKDCLFSLVGDTVEVVLSKSKKRKSRGFVAKVLKRKKDSFVGKIQTNNSISFFIPDDYRVYFHVFIPPSKNLRPSLNKKVHVVITSWGDENKSPVGKIKAILGNQNDHETEISSLLVAGGFSSSFDKSIEQIAKNIPQSITKKEISSRLDLRNTLTFTIDPLDAKDFDDALSVKQLKNKNWEIGVHIADVGHYIKDGGQIDKEALKRGNSVYLVDRVIPMLPESLSNDLCSLKPNCDRLCFSVIFELSRSADILGYRIVKTIIHSDKRFTYEEAQKNITAQSGLFYKELTQIKTLSLLLRERRTKNGSITFEKAEVSFILDKKKNPVDVAIKESIETNKLVEEYMLLANKTIAKHLNSGKNIFPFIYRIHDIPDKERILDLKNLVKKFGHSINSENPVVLSKSLNNLLLKIKGQPEQNLIETLIIRSMAKAIYSTKNIGHYGLSFSFYSHFTSPIRRYPDLITHRLLYDYISKNKHLKSDNLDYVCKHCSETEKLASIAERDSIKFMQVKYLANKIGEQFSGVITGVTDWGLYVELDNNKCEGLVKINNISDDYFVFDKKTHSIIGHSTNKQYQLGQKVNVTVLKADLERKQLDFSLL